MPVETSLPQIVTVLCLYSTVYPLYTLKSNTAPSEVSVTSTPTAYIRSHSLFNFGQGVYPNEEHKTLILNEFPDTASLTLEFSYLNIGTESSCKDNINSDILTIDTETESIFTCSDVSSTIPTEVISFSQYPSKVTFIFETNSAGQYGGFLLKYSGM